MTRLFACGQYEANYDAVLFGDAGADFIAGDGYQGNNLGAYTPIERHGNDLLIGGAGADILVGQGGDDELLGGDDDDHLWGDDASLVDTPASIHGSDHLDGGAGNDELVGNGQADSLLGGTGNDTLWGDDSTLPLSEQGDDHLDREPGNDIGANVNIAAYGVGLLDKEEVRRPPANDERFEDAA